MRMFDMSWRKSPYEVVYADIIVYFSTPEKPVSIEELTEFLNVCSPYDIDNVREAVIEDRTRRWNGE